MEWIQTHSFIGLLNACASAGALEEGRNVHAHIIEKVHEPDVFVGASLLDMYAKCGSLEDAKIVFNKMHTRDVVSWSTMLAGYALHGNAKRALGHFERMYRELEEVNEVTFLSLLSACRHGGLVGLHYFESMTAGYGTSPSVEHLACVVDLLGRAGYFHQAEDLLRSIPFRPPASVWRSLLGACRIHGNLGMAERIAKRALELSPDKASGCVLLSNIYAAAGKWDSSAIIQEQRQLRGVKKQPGRTWIEVNKETHSFVVDDQEHDLMEEIRAKVDTLLEQVKEAGCVPDTSFALRGVDALRDVDEERKEGHLCRHSEKTGNCIWSDQHASWRPNSPSDKPPGLW